MVWWWWWWWGAEVEITHRQAGELAGGAGRPWAGWWLGQGYGEARAGGQQSEAGRLELRRMDGRRVPPEHRAAHSTQPLDLFRCASFLKIVSERREEFGG